MGLFARTPDPNWESVESFKNFLKDSGKSSGTIRRRIDMAYRRLDLEHLAQESIIYFFGDGLSENLETIYDKVPPELEKLSERQLDSFYLTAATGNTYLH